MRCKIHDTTAYGIYNGISEFDISDFAFATAEELGLDPTLDCRIRDLARFLNNDKELERLAQDTYVPFPMHDGWSDEYKAYYRKAVADRTAPGQADIPDDLVYAKIRGFLQHIADEVLPPRRAKEEADAKEREQIMSQIETIETKEEKIRDEGGWTTRYIHSVYMKSGNVFEFADVNVFDFGRVIKPTYLQLNGKPVFGILSSSLSNDHPAWVRWDQSVIAPLSDEELNAYTAVDKYCGHSKSGIRM